MAPGNLSNSAVTNKLRARWAVFLFIGWTAIVNSYLFWQQDGFASFRWLIIASSAFLWQTILFYLDLSKNTPINRRSLLPGFGSGTWLSLFRLLLLSLLAGFLFSPRPAGWLSWMPFTLYLLFNLVDLLDGYAARRWGQVTRLGEKLDLDLDGRGMLLGSLLAIQYGSAGWWYLLVGAARYLYVAGLRLRRRQGLPVIEKPNPLSRPLAGLQMGVGTALLAPVLFPPYTILVSTLTMVAFIGNFLHDWLIIGKENNPKQLVLPSVSKLLPLFLRGIIVALLAYRISSGAIGAPSLFVEFFFATALILGAGTRILSLALLIHLGLVLHRQPPQMVELALSFCSLAIVYLGAGSLFLWAPENSILQRRLGEQRAK